MTKAKAKASAKAPGNRQRTGKPGGRTRTSWKPGKSGNPKGRPPKGQTWRDVFNEILAMQGSHVADWIALLAKDFDKVGAVRLRDAIAAKVIISLIADPTPGLLRVVMERTDGLLPQAPPDLRASLRLEGMTDAEVEGVLNRIAEKDRNSLSGMLERIRDRPFGPLAYDNEQEEGNDSVG